MTATMACSLMCTSDFKDLCRLCAAKTSVLLGLHIFDKEGDTRQIFKKIRDCLPVQVTSTDRLPKMVCEECVYKLDLLSEFRDKSLKTEHLLEGVLKSSALVPQNTNGISDTENMNCVIEDVHSVTTGLPDSVRLTETVSDDNHLNSDVIHTDEEDPLRINVTEALSDTVLDAVTGTPSEKLQPSVNEILSEDMVGNAPVERSISGSSCGGVSTRISESNISGIKCEPDIETVQCFIKNEAWASDSNESESDGEENTSQSQEISYETKMEVKKIEIVTESTETLNLRRTEDTLLAHCIEAHPESKAEKKCNVVRALSPSSHGTTTPDNTSTTSTDLATPEKGKTASKRKKWEPKVCKECGKQYRTNYKLSEHMRKHTGEKPFQCSMCPKAFRSKIGLAQHEAKHTGQFDYTCNTCGKGFQCKSYLIVHQRVHSDVKPYPCTTCGRNFKTKQALLDHHNRHLGVKPYVCETCGRRFITKGLCKSHQRVHSGTDNKQYPCSVCNKLFVSKSYLSTHLRIHTGEKPFMCEVCGKGFLTRVDLRIHSTMHTGEKSFVCEWCGKAFARRDALRCHRRSHTGERPYSCDICGQSFTQFSPLTIHKRLHTGERPYSCDVCSRAFVSKSTMMSHRKKHTT